MTRFLANWLQHAIGNPPPATTADCSETCIRQGGVASVAALRRRLFPPQDGAEVRMPSRWATIGLSDQT
jgi:hypothetical protein